jgi:hypothetical protein
MADLGQHQMWIVKLEKSEMKLVLHALRGVLSEEEVEKAKALGDNLTVLKAKLIQGQARENDKLIDNLREAGIMEESVPDSSLRRKT